MARIGIILPDEMKEAIVEEGKKQDREMSWIVRKAIEEYLEKRQQNTEK